MEIDYLLNSFTNAHYSFGDPFEWNTMDSVDTVDTMDSMEKEKKQ